MLAPSPRDALASARAIAVLGAHTARHKPACYVPDYLAAQGYRILPVNPGLVGRQLWGQPVRATLAELDEPVDIVDVFRRADALMGHLDDLLAMRPAPGLVWLQLGLRHEGLAAALAAAGVPTIQDRCTLADHRRFGLPPVGSPT